MSDRGSFSGDMAVEANENKKKEEVEGRRGKPKVPLIKLFSFADFYDCVLMGVGSVGACVHGASVPVFFIFFGKIINVIGLAYLFPKEASHQVAKVCFLHNNKLRTLCVVFFPCNFHLLGTAIPSSSSLKFVS